ncbi:hypothetical protein DM02DRAFT_657854 [Periconia macrospinosa]|uniref:Uncharacterized protein n=1 Tax=Periconia macrospinosa TaxID=97972 RepID=A0A2V1DIG7_9PLEO|nr:hypothetical protein DM02DRAFT_657854 [Periconia macrospinosa]
MSTHSGKYDIVEDGVSNAAPRISNDSSDPCINPMKRRSHLGRLFWTEICWRLAAILIFSTITTIILHRFSLKGVLSSWETRWFNALNILFSSLVSLSVGSLLGLLGTMLRWPLLARKLHTPVDVDLILGMSNPTGAFKLIWTHIVCKRKFSVTTAVVLVYLLVNVIGRLSVAAFGLTFSLNEQPRIEPPVYITDWGVDNWFNKTFNSSDYNSLEKHHRHMNRYATIGLSNVPSDDFDSNNPLTYNATNITKSGMSRAVESDNVKYSYYLKEYRGKNETSSQTKVFHSSSSCFGTRMAVENKIVSVDGGRMVENLSSNSINETSMKILQLIVSILPNTQDDIVWAAPLNYSERYQDSCGTTYLYTELYRPKGKNREMALFECFTCISYNNSIPGPGPLEPSNTTSSYDVSSLLHRIGSFDRVWGGRQNDSYSVRVYSGMNKNEHFANNLNEGFKKSNTTDITRQANLHAAHLVARLPLLAILGADIQLPRVTLIPNALPQKFVDRKLGVSWRESIPVLVSIFVGQTLAIGTVFFYCRKVFIRDHASNLSVARLLKTTIENVNGMSTHAGDKIAEYLEKEGKMMRYGTRRNDNGVLEVDLWNDVENEFPDAVYR